MTDDAWQSIETAPKDGTEIEVFYENLDGFSTFAFWFEKPTRILGSKDALPNPPGWAGSRSSQANYRICLSTPTHYRLVPEEDR